MDEQQKRDVPCQREITYRVGWSRGTIQAKVADQRGKPGKQSDLLIGAVQSQPSGPPYSAAALSGSSTMRCQDFTYRGLHRESFMERVVWRSVPAIPARWITMLLWSISVVGFALTYVLVLALTRTP